MIKAGAIIIGDRLGSAAALFDIAADLGFVFVAPYGGRPMLTRQARDTNPVMFLFADRPDPTAYAPIVKEIRQGAPLALVGAPLVYFSESPSRAVISACAGIGITDILTLPFTRERLTARLSKLVARRPQNCARQPGAERRRLSGNWAEPPARAPLSAQSNRRRHLTG